MDTDDVFFSFFQPHNPPAPTPHPHPPLICVHDDKGAVTGNGVHVETRVRAEWAEHLGSDRST